MGIPVMVLGESGSGKSTSLRNFKAGEIGIINVSRKPLPFQTDIKPFNSDNYTEIATVIKNAKTRSIAVDDAQYLLANEYMRNAKVNGYQKFTDIALNAWNLIRMVTAELPEDRIVYFLWHTETTETGKEKAKTIGKMLDQYITLEGMFTVVLKTSVQDGHYFFATQTNGNDTVKTPLGMFSQPYIDNDLAAVDKVIRDFYGITAPKKEAKKDG